MKGFKKLILTSAILAASSSAMAMQAMDDESLSGTTGQDGITVVLDTNVTTDIKWIDRDGIPGVPTYSHAGAVVISGVNIVSTGLKIVMDAGGDTGSGAGANGMLNIGVYNPNGITINLGASSIKAADAMDTPVGNLAARSATGAGKDIITFGAGSTLTIAGAGAAGPRLMDIQLGSEATDFITLNGNLGTVTLTGMKIIDADGGANASIGIGTLTLDNINLTNATVNVVPAGLTINTGTGLNNVSVGMERLGLGDTALAGNGFIGDVYLTGLNIANNTVTISGH